MYVSAYLAFCNQIVSSNPSSSNSWGFLRRSLYLPGAFASLRTSHWPGDPLLRKTVGLTRLIPQATWATPPCKKFVESDEKQMESRNVTFIWIFWGWSNYTVGNHVFQNSGCTSTGIFLWVLGLGRLNLWSWNGSLQWFEIIGKPKTGWLDLLSNREQFSCPTYRSAPTALSDWCFVVLYHH